MALSDLTFKLYTDSGLTSAFSGTLQLTHETDLSDNPQDFTLYFGSTNASRQLQANSNPGVDEITLSIIDALQDWDTATAYALGDTVEPTTPNDLIYECTTAGTSHATTEPTWPTVGIGSTVADGTCVWTLKGARHDLDEVTLGLTSGDLDTNTPGDPLDLGTTITGGSGNAVEVHIRVENAVTSVRNNTGHPELAISINEVIESEV